MKMNGGYSIFEGRGLFAKEFPSFDKAMQTLYDYHRDMVNKDRKKKRVIKR